MHDNDTKIMVSVTALNEGDPDLAVSYGLDARPVSMGDADWFSHDYLSDRIIITAN